MSMDANGKSDKQILVQNENHSAIAEVLVSVSMCIKNVGLYGKCHPVVSESIDTAHSALSNFLAINETLDVAVTDSYIALGSFPLEDTAGSLATLTKNLSERKVSALMFKTGVTKEEIISFAEALSLAPSDLLLQGGLQVELRKLKINNIKVSFGIVPMVSRAAKDAADIYEEALLLIEDAFRAVQEGLQFAVTDVRLMVSDAMQSILSDESALLALSGVKSYDRYLSEHSVNVCILSMIIAKDLQMEPSMVLELGIGALLHDAGKVFVPDEIVSKTGKLTESEWEIIKRHPIDGARALAGIPDLPALAPTIALEHHMHSHGLGYPSIPGNNPHLLSRLVSIMDTYDALTTDRPFRKRWSSTQAIGWMLYEAWEHYDRQLLARFASRVKLCPVGSLVRLKNGDLAIVVGGNYKTAKTPTIKLIAQGSKKAGRMESIDLSVCNDDSMQIAEIARPTEMLLPYTDLLVA